MPSDVTQILMAVERGDRQASDQLLCLVYAELRRLAAARLGREKPGQTMQATALVHEAYLRLVDNEAPQTWDCRGHFFAAAAEAMRRILVENARRKHSIKRGGDLARHELHDAAAVASESHGELLELDEALTRLAENNERAAEVVKLRYFSGLTIPQIAEILSVSPRTVDHLWSYARAWLHQELHGPEK